MIHLRDILRATKGRLLTGDENLEFKGVSTDSRKIEEGYLFVPIRGEKFDGHEFIEDALNCGAMGTLCSHEMDIKSDGKKSIIMVEDTLKALQNISKYFLNRANIPVVGVTGSTGKTTTKELIYNVLAQKFKVLKNKGNFNNHIGMPLTLLNIKEEHEIIVLEMGMSNRGEIDLLAEITTPEVGVITNIGICHIENLGSKEEIFKAKMEISHYMDESSVLIVNGDNEYLGRLRERDTKYKRVFAGLRENNDIYVEEIRDLGDKGIEFSILYGGETHDFKLNVPGIHNVYNGLLAIAVGVHYNISFEKIKDGLSNFYGNEMRMNIVSLDDDMKLINDCYNASPDSVKAALGVLESIESKRKIAILGDMLELGDYSEDAHREVGRMVSRREIDFLITVGNDAENIGKEAIETGLPRKKVFTLANNEAAINLLDTLKQPGDTILVKGSRGMKMEEIVQYLQERR